MKKLRKLFYLFITLAFVGILATSCEREIPKVDSDSLKTVIVEEGKKVIVDEKIDATFEVIEENIPNLYETIDESKENELRSSCYTVAYLGASSVCWYSDHTRALWIRHYAANGNYISTTRKDVSVGPCRFVGGSYNAPGGRATSVAFVGYLSNGTESYP